MTMIIYVKYKTMNLFKIMKNNSQPAPTNAPFGMNVGYTRICFYSLGPCPPTN